MKGKILFVVGLGVGYVLGTRAGRERYEQIKTAAEKVWNQPTVQQGVGTVKEFAMAKVGDVSDTVLDSVKQFVGTATKSASGSKRATPAKTAASTATSTTATKPSGSTSSTSRSSTAKSSTSKPSTATSSTGNGSSASDD